MSGRAYRLREDALMAVEAGDELVALDLRSSMYLGTNASGRLLWRRLGTDATADELAALLCASYAIDPEAAARDVAVFLDELAAASLLAGGQSGT